MLYPSLGIWVEEAEITEYYDDETLEIVAEKIRKRY